MQNVAVGKLTQPATRSSYLVKKIFLKNVFTCIAMRLAASVHLMSSHLWKSTTEQTLGMTAPFLPPSTLLLKT